MENRTNEYKEILNKNQRHMYVALVLQINLMIVGVFVLYYNFLFSVLWTDAKKEVFLLSAIMTLTILFQSFVTRRVLGYYLFALKVREEMIHDYQKLLEQCATPIVMEELVKSCERYDRKFFRFLYTPKIKRG